MIIIPAEKNFDWQHAPIVTALLILANLLIFSLWQSQDSEKLENIVQYYKTSDLPALEYPIYLSYLYQSEQAEFASHTEKRWDAGDREGIYHNMATDLGFIYILNQTDQAFWGADDYTRWLTQHQKIEQQARKLSFIQFGLSPSEERPITYFTAPFLHSDWSQLIGNMVFLAIAGLAVEAAIGSFFFLITYVLCGLLAGFTFTLLSSSIAAPLVGAGGAISGVLAMYGVVYGLRNIRFLLFVVVYFRFFRAPALILLPIWVAIESLQLFLRSDLHSDLLPELLNTFSAHLGGVIAGGGVIYTFKRWMIAEDTQSLESSDDDTQYREALDDAFKQLAAFNFDSAKKKFSALNQEYPENITIKIQCYHLEKLSGNQKAIDRWALEVFEQGMLQNVRLQNVHDLYCDYRSQTDAVPLPYSLDIKLLLAFINLNQLDTAKRVIKHLNNSADKDIMLVKAFNSLAAALERNEQTDDAYRYRNMAGSLQETLQLTSP
ncbi:MAG: hypothetical protein COA99_06320 [Moraxellaceae bacterium]|nr:MAG: hypothetical protein COA99_06320 [Moraxellaceae bacterium]